MWASIIIGTSLAPSPIERVIHFLLFLARPTTSAFYFGETLQHTTEAARIPSLKNLLEKSSSSSTNDRVGPSITIDRRWPSFRFYFLNSSMFKMSILWMFGNYRDSYFNFLRSSSLLELDKISSYISGWISLQLLPISIAVSCLSPVSTQTLILALISISIVSGTPY